MIQEVASKGLVFVYETGDEEMKKQLVDGLMDTLSSGKKGFKLSKDSELFPKETLGKAPDGGSLSTYKELSSLANEMGKPELVYKVTSSSFVLRKFMNLASHHSLWNSRKGAAFATTHIMAQAKEQLEPFLASLVPKLYRYSYDPNPRIAASMKSIFSSLVDSKKAVTQYLDKIIPELLEGLISNVWRTREGSALALSDALQGRVFDEVKDFLGEMWYRCFRVVDDVKVRSFW